MSHSRAVEDYLLEILDKLDIIEEFLSIKKKKPIEKRTVLTIQVNHSLESEGEKDIWWWTTMVERPGAVLTLDSGFCEGSEDKAHLKALYIGLQQLSFSTRAEEDILIRSSEPLICDVIQGTVQESRGLLAEDAHDYVEVVEGLLARFPSVEVEFTG